MNTETFNLYTLYLNIGLAIIQTLTLIFLAIYVIKTWQIASATRKSTEISEKILKEMLETRDQEIAPYVVIYIDLPYGDGGLMYLMVKNIGKSVAKDIRLDFEPPLINSYGEEIGNIPLIKDGIKSLPPGYELKTFFDHANAYKGKELPQKYIVRISYTGGLLSEVRNLEQTIDLSIHEGLSYIDRKGIHQLVNYIEKLVQHNDKIGQQLDKISNNMVRGIWIRNPDILVSNLQLNHEEWKSTLLSKLIEFKTLWSSVYGEKHNKLINPFFTDLKNGSTNIGVRILTLASHAPFGTRSKLIDRLYQIGVNLYELGQVRFNISDNTIDKLGAEIIDQIERAVGILNQTTNEDSAPEIKAGTVVSETDNTSNVDDG